MRQDHFRPTTQPAQAIYDAFSAESGKRKGKSFEEWRQNENNAVHNAAIIAAKELHLREPTMADVESAEQFACGHSDYGAQWAYKLTEAMRAGA